MKPLLSIFLILSSASLPGFAADGDSPAIMRRVYRSVSSPAEAATPTLPKEPVAMTRRIVAPLSPVDSPIVEPPIPKSYIDDAIVNGPAEPVGEEVIDKPEEIKTKTVRESDADKALGIAQSYFRRGLWESAGEWYLMALDWNPDSVAAAEGFVMSAFHAGQYNYAYRVGNDISKSIPGVKEKVMQAATEEINLLLKDNLLDEAEEVLQHFPLDEPGLQNVRAGLNARRSQPTVVDQSARIVRATEPGKTASNPLQSAFLQAASDFFKEQKYTNSLWNLEQAESEGPLDRSAQMLRGWSLYQVGEYSDAATLFETLYKTQTDIASARGIVVSLRKKGDHDRLELLVKKWGGILAGESKAVETAAFDLNDINVVSNE